MKMTSDASNLYHETSSAPQDYNLSAGQPSADSAPSGADTAPAQWQNVDEGTRHRLFAQSQPTMADPDYSV